MNDRIAEDEQEVRKETRLYVLAILLTIWVVVIVTSVLWSKHKPKPQFYQTTTVFVTNSTGQAATIKLPPEYNVIGSNGIAPTGMSEIVFEIIPYYGAHAYIIQIK